MPRVRTVKKKPISDKQRESDDKLRRELQNFNLKKFDKALEKAIQQKKPDGHS